MTANLKTTCVAALLATSGLAAPAYALTEMVIGVPTTISLAGTAPLLAGLELGYFEEEGIDLKLQEFQGGAAMLPLLANKTVILGEGGVDPLVGAVQSGTQLPIRSFYTHSQRYIWQWAVPQDSPIETIEDLKGMTIGVGALGNSHMPVSRHIMAQAGLTEGEDYNFLAISVGAPAFRALTTGQVDAYNTWNTNIATYEGASGETLRLLPLSDDINSLAGSGYYAHIDTIEQQPELLEAFGRAVSKAILVCTHAPTWCVTSIWDSYPHLAPRGDRETELTAAVHVINAQATGYLTHDLGTPAAFGQLDDAYLPTLLKIMGAQEAVAAAGLGPSDFYTNQFVPAYNDFDVDALKAYAQELEAAAQ